MSKNSFSQLPTYLQTALTKLYWPASNSHKGQNGKLLILGGSELFHAASKWSLDIASRLVDMVFYSSVPSNNRLIRRYFEQRQLTVQAKESFWDGIVVEQKNIKHYVMESDCILIGPGMDRSAFTQRFTHQLLKKYPEKRWVIDAGALQMIDPHLLNERCIITPHHQEMKILQKKVSAYNPDNYQGAAFCLLKGESDTIFAPQTTQALSIQGGNAGMSKGGTGDVLAGLTAALYCKNSALTSCLVASFINKQAGDALYEKQGVYFNASDLVEQIPQTLFRWKKLTLENN